MHYWNIIKYILMKNENSLHFERNITVNELEVLRVLNHVSGKLVGSKFGDFNLDLYIAYVLS